MSCQHGFRWWLGFVRQRTFSWAHVDSDLCRHRPWWSMNHFREKEIWLPIISLLWNDRKCKYQFQISDDESSPTRANILAERHNVMLVTAPVQGFTEYLKNEVLWLAKKSNGDLRLFFERDTDKTIMLVMIYVQIYILLIDLSITQCNTAVSPLLTQWRYCSLALSHRYINSVYLTLSHTPCTQSSLWRLWSKASGVFNSVRN